MRAKQQRRENHRRFGHDLQSEGLCGQSRGRRNDGDSEHGRADLKANGVRRHPSPQTLGGGRHHAGEDGGHSESDQKNPHETQFGRGRCGKQTGSEKGDQQRASHETIQPHAINNRSQQDASDTDRSEINTRKNPRQFGVNLT